MEWLDIRMVWPHTSESRNRLVFKTVNNKLLVLPNIQAWHIDKYSITHFIILPE